MTSTRIRVQQLRPDPTQPRKSLANERLDDIVASIHERGLLLPLRVRPADSEGRHVIVSGHRRHAALVKLGIQEVPCIIVEGPLDDATILAEQLAENIHRENLSPIEEADGYRRYMTLKGVSATQAALELAVPASRISRSLPLLDFPEKVQAAIQAGMIAKDTAYHLAKLPDGAERNQLISQALAGDLSRDSASRAAKVAQKPTTQSNTVKRVVCQLGGGRSLTVQGSAVQLESMIEMLEDVLREARKARTLGWELSTLTRVFKDRSKTGGSA